MDYQRLFPGIDQKSRFNCLLHEWFITYKDKCQANGDDVTKLGSHSIRKGAATYCCAAAYPAPSIVSVCLRAGWTLDRVNECNLKYENTGDELVGRTLKGIPPMSGGVGVSPCFFHSNANLIFIKNNIIFPKQDVKALNLIHSMMACFIDFL